MSHHQLFIARKSSKKRVPRQVELWEPRLSSGTCGTLTTCKQGRRKPCPRGTAESLGLLNSKPGETASAPRQACERPRRTATAEVAVFCGRRFSQRAGTVGGRLSHPQPARENRTTRTTGKSATVSMNWGISMVFAATWTMGISLCAKTGVSTTFEDSNCRTSRQFSLSGPRHHV